jgi:superfamily II DNA or RNA helicase
MIEAPTGCGKSRFKGYAPLQFRDLFDIFVFVFPTLALMRQFIEGENENLTKVTKTIIGTSSMGNPDVADEDAKSLAEARKLCNGGMFTSLESDALRDRLKSSTTKTIVCTTYDSLRIFTGKVLSDVLATETKAIFASFDEGHHATEKGNVPVIFERPFYTKALFYSASFPNEVKNGVSCTDEFGAVHSMGEKLIKIGYTEARDEGILKNIKIVAGIIDPSLDVDRGNDDIYKTFKNAFEVSKVRNRRNVIVHASPNFKSADKESLSMAHLSKNITSVEKAVSDVFGQKTRFQAFFLFTEESPEKSYEKIEQFNAAARQNICKDNGVVMLVNCKKGKEGVDTKYANFDLFIDPKSSFVEIIQAVGRVLRITDEDHTLGNDEAIIYLNTVMDLEEVAETEAVVGESEDEISAKKDAIIRRNMKAGKGTFSIISSVIAALCCSDEGIRRQILAECFKFRVECIVSRKLKKKDVAVSEEVFSPDDINLKDSTVLEIEDLGKDAVIVAENTSKIGEETQKDVFVKFVNPVTDETEIRKVCSVDDAPPSDDSSPTSGSSATISFKNQSSEAILAFPASRHSISEIICGGMAAVVKCSAFGGSGDSLEEKAVAKARAVVEWSKANGSRKPSKKLNSKTAEQKASASDADKLEHSHASWLGHMKKAKTGKGTTKLYPSVEEILDSHFGSGWHEKEDLEGSAVTKAKEVVEWSKANGSRKPSQKLKTAEQKASASDADKLEHSHASWLGHMKKAKTGKGTTKLYPSVEEILASHFGSGWHEKEDLEGSAVEKAREVVEWSKANGSRKPSHKLVGNPASQKTAASDADKLEHSYASWLGHMKKAKAGKGHMKLYPSVEEILTSHFGGSWHEDLEGAAVATAKEVVEWSKANGSRKPSQKLNGKTSTQKESASDADKLENSYAVWLSGMKRAKAGKGNTKLYPSVEEILASHFGSSWYAITKKPSKNSSASSSYTSVESRSITTAFSSDCGASSSIPSDVDDEQEDATTANTIEESEMTPSPQTAITPTPPTPSSTTKSSTPSTTRQSAGQKAAATKRAKKEAEDAATPITPTEAEEDARIDAKIPNLSPAEVSTYNRNTKKLVYAQSHSPSHKAWKADKNRVFAEMVMKFSGGFSDSASIVYLDDPANGENSSTGIFMQAPYGFREENLHIPNTDEAKIKGLKAISKTLTGKRTTKLNTYKCFDYECYSQLPTSKINGAYIDTCSGSADSIITSIKALYESRCWKIGGEDESAFVLSFTITTRDPSGDIMDNRIRKIRLAIKAMWGGGEYKLSFPDLESDDERLDPAHGLVRTYFVIIS